MRKLNGLTEVLAIATVVLLGHPDTAQAQSLQFNPSAVTTSITAPGLSSGPTSVNVTSSVGLSSLNITSINTTDRTNWLCATVANTNQINVYIGITTGSCPTTTTNQLSANQTYTGTIALSANGSITGTLNVTLTVGSGGGGNGLVASPSSISFNAAFSGQSIPSQNVSVFFNGQLANITSFVFTPTSGGAAFLITSTNGGTATLSANTGFVNGTYSGTETFNTVFGSVNVPVTLTIGSSGGGGVVASPPSLSFIVATPGAQAGSQQVSVTVNGAATAINSFSFTPTSGGVSFVNTTISFSTATLTVNTNLNQGVYTGTETLNTNFGSVSVPVTLTIGSGGGNLVFTPNPVAFSVQTGGTAAAQNVTVLANNTSAHVTGVSASTTTGQNWLLPSVSPSLGLVTLNINAAFLSAGSYTGTVTVSAQEGTGFFQVNLTVGSSGGNLVFNPNPVAFNVQTGGTVPSRDVIVLANNTSAHVTGVSASTTTGQNWLLPSVSPSLGIVTVSINAASLSSGSYTGTVNVNAQEGTGFFQVNLTVGGTPTLVVTPAVLNFAYQTGTLIPQSQTIQITSNGTPINYSVSSSTSSGGTQWLIVSPLGVQQTTPGSLTVSVQPAGLQAGVTYTGNIQINTFGGASNPTVNIPVNLLVSTNPILSTSPTALTFTSQAGGAPAAQTLTLQSSSTPLNYSVNSSVTTPAGFNWLQVGTQAGTTPGTVTVSVVTAGLATGTYSGVVNISSSNAGNTFVQVPVTLNITAGAAVTLSPSALSFAFQIGQFQPQSQTVTVSSPGGGQTGFSLAAQTSSGGNWLNVSSTTGIAPGSFVVSVTTGGLTAGSYSGTITVTPTSGTPVTLPVTLVVSNTALLVTSPSTITFSAQQGATNFSTQNVSITSTDGTTINYGIAVNYTSSGTGWLFVNSSTGATPSVLSLTANPSNLAIGTYTATVTLSATSTAVANSPQVIQVTLNVTSNATLASSPSTLSFSQNTNGTPPPNQTLSITSSGTTAVTFSATATTNQGGNWLSVSPNNGVTPATLTVSANALVNGFPLSPGTYTGQILISSPGSSNSVTVTVTLTVQNAQTITASPTSFNVSYQAGSANPAPLTLAVNIVGGGTAPLTTTATTSSGGAWLSATPTLGTIPQNITVTINPAGLAASTIPYQGTISLAVAGATNSPLNIPVTLTVTPAPVIAPTVTSINNGASNLSTSVSPGLNITLVGTNMGPGAITLLHVGASGLLDTNVAGTTVTFDGILSPIIYTSSTQVSVMVPYEIAGRATVSMVVTYNGASSSPIQLRVVDSAPAIYTLNQTGTGQGAILNQNGTVNSPANPEIGGNVIQIFGTGEGTTAPRGVTGSLNPNRLPLPVPVLPINVTVGGVPIPPADFFYVGEAPGLVAGVIQIDVKLPLGLQSGPNQIFFTVGGAPSQGNVTVSVR